KLSCLRRQSGSRRCTELISWLDRMDSSRHSNVALTRVRSRERARSGEQKKQKLERETGIEPATSGLGSRRSTAELLPLSRSFGQHLNSLTGARHSRAGLRVMQRPLPHPTHLLCRLRHWLTRLAGECLRELRHVYYDAIDAVLGRRMWI